MAITAALLTACATTVDDAGVPSDGAVVDQDADVSEVPAGALPALESNEPIDGGVVTGSTPDTTIPVVGSAADLLPEIAIDMSRLGSQIADGGEADETLARIVGAWDAIRAEIRTTHPELVNGIGVTVEMAQTAVERTRPADADKAFGILTDLVDRFTGDG